MEANTNQEEHPYQGIVKMLEDALRFTKPKARREHLRRVAPLVVYYGRQLPKASPGRLNPVINAMWEDDIYKALDLVTDMISQDEEARE
jgi:hypothetical protein